jgi:hypothetical protein
MTLAAINGLNVISSVLQAIPNLQVQVLTIITWMVSRFFMYSRWAWERLAWVQDTQYRGSSPCTKGRAESLKAARGC